MKFRNELFLIAAAVALSLPSSAQVVAPYPTNAVDTGATATAPAPWYQTSAKRFNVTLIDNVNMVRIVFNAPKFDEGHFLFVQSYDIHADKHLMLPAGVNMFEVGEEVFYELERSQLERVDGVAFKLFTSAPRETGSALDDPAAPIFVDAVFHNPKSDWAAPRTFPVSENSGPAFGVTNPSSTEPPITAPLGPKMHEVGIVADIMGYFTTYCCPAVSLDEDGDPTGPFLNEKGRVLGCNVSITLASGGDPVPIILIPGQCETVSGLTTASSSGKYWKKSKK